MLVLIVVVQVEPFPLHPPPDHPEKIEFVPGVSVRVSLSRGMKTALQVCPQLIPEGLLVTVP
jgi:hypothetical protein